MSRPKRGQYLDTQTGKLMRVYYRPQRVTWVREPLDAPEMTRHIEPAAYLIGEDRGMGLGTVTAVPLTQEAWARLITLEEAACIVREQRQRTAP